MTTLDSITAQAVLSAYPDGGLSAALQATTNRTRFKDQLQCVSNSMFQY